MPWKSKSETERKEALVGSHAVVRKSYQCGFTSKEKNFLEQVSSSHSRFFAPISISSDADWLVNHAEPGQTFEQYWRTYVSGEGESDTWLRGGARCPRRRSVMSFEPGGGRSAVTSRRQVTVGILPIGLFPGNEKNSGECSSSSPSSNVFLAWLQIYCKAFFHNSKVIIAQPVRVSDVSCRYRVNKHTGRFQLKADDILKYMKMIKPGYLQCMIAITMIDLYPEPSWNFVFGLASPNTDGSIGGVGIFSFARFADGFKAASTRDKDKMKTNPDGSLNYSVFEKSLSRNDSSTLPITGLLLRRACNVMAHEIGHMFGMMHCIWMKCVMNGSNHLEETDANPSYLCPVCLRKLQAILQFNLLDRYRGLRDWMTPEFWNKCKCEPNETLSAADETSKQHFQFHRTSLPDYSRPSTSKTLRDVGASISEIDKASGASISARGRRLSMPATALIIFKEKSSERQTREREAQIVLAPPLAEFDGFRDWLNDAIKILSTH